MIGRHTLAIVTTFPLYCWLVDGRGWPPVLLGWLLSMHQKWSDIVGEEAMAQSLCAAHRFKPLSGLIDGGQHIAAVAQFRHGSTNTRTWRRLTHRSHWVWLVRTVGWRQRHCRLGSDVSWVGQITDVGTQHCSRVQALEVYVAHWQRAGHRNSHWRKV